MGIPKSSFTNQDLPEDSTCVICQNVLEEAVKVKCGHKFCLVCLAKWFKENLNCPTCRYEIKGIIVSRMSVRVLRLILSVPDVDQVSMDRELQDQIKNREVACQNVGCNVRMRARQLRSHDEFCEFRQLSLIEATELVSEFVRDLSEVMHHVKTRVTVAVRPTDIGWSALMIPRAIPPNVREFPALQHVVRNLAGTYLNNNA